MTTNPNADTNTDTILQDGDTIYITLEATFAINRDLDDDDEFREVEFEDIPPEVQKEVLVYLQSSDFIHRQAEDYATKEITAQNCFINYPAYDTRFDKIYFRVFDKTLQVTLEGTLVEVPPEVYKQNVLNSGALNPKTECTSWVHLSDYIDHIQDGFHKATHSGPLVSSFGQYIGDDPGRWAIYFDYKRITAYLG